MLAYLSSHPRGDERQRPCFDITAHFICRPSSPPDGLAIGYQTEGRVRQDPRDCGRGNWVFLPPRPFVFLVSLSLLPLSASPLCLSVLRNPIPLYVYPTHLTPQNLPFGRICIFCQTLRAELVPGFCISILSSLVWDALRAQRRNGCPGKLQLWVLRSRKEIPNSTPQHQSSHFLTAARSAHDPGTGNIQSSHASVKQSLRAVY